MEFHQLGAAILAVLATSGSIDPVAACPRQPVPAAVDFPGPWENNMVMDSLTFAATPSLQSPTRAWLVRMHRFGPRDIKVNIVKLRSEPSCNRYRIERRWTASINSVEYDQTIALIEPFVTPPDRLFSVKDPRRAEDEIAVDGTALSLRAQTLGWNVSRNIHASSGGGKSLSAIFYKIVAAHVSQDELPTLEWRNPRSATARPGK